MTPLLLFVLSCLAIYIGSVQVAFSALMRLPLRLNAQRSERHGRVDVLRNYLDEPIRLFLPARLVQALNVGLVTMLLMVEVRPLSVSSLALVFGGLLVYVTVFSHLLPLLLVRRNPERLLEILLPAFNVLVGLLDPLSRLLVNLLYVGRRDYKEDAALSVASRTLGVSGDSEFTSHEDIHEHEERELLQSVVEFGDTLVREVMTPRPDVVAVKVTADLFEVRTLFSEQQYSRIPVFRESLDDILGFVFVKDLLGVTDADNGDRVIEQLLRPAYAVPETKRVAELLKELQRQQVQSAIVHDEYGGTAGLVTIEDLLEEIVGEIRDEYDVESDPIVSNTDGSFVFSGNVSVDDLSDRLQIDVERHGFETVGGYLLSRLGRVPRVGEKIQVDGMHVEILEAERRRVNRVKIRRQANVNPT